MLECAAGSSAARRGRCWIKEEHVTLSVLPQAWWLVVAADIGRAVQVCVRPADEDGRAVLACVCPADEDSEFWSATGATSEAELPQAWRDAAGGEDT